MTDQDKKESYILVRFADIGSAVFEIQFENVTPAQVLSVAAILDVQGKNGFIQEENRRLERMRQNQIVVPNPDILTAKR